MSIDARIQFRGIPVADLAENTRRQPTNSGRFGSRIIRADEQGKTAQPAADQTLKAVA